MPVVVLVRHGRTTANASGVLAGWAPDVHLDETGRAQADTVGRRLADAPIQRIVASPLPRCQETAFRLADGLAAVPGPPIETEADLGEAHYGAWTGRPLEDLATEDLWSAVQSYPSSVTFPASEEFAHESMRTMQTRAVEAVRRLDDQVRVDAGDGGVLVVVSHGDVIKAILADALGTPLDLFQRIVVDPASISIVRYTKARPFLLSLNDTGTDPLDLTPLTVAAATGAGEDAAVGGGAGAGTMAADATDGESIDPQSSAT